MKMLIANILIWCLAKLKISVLKCHDDIIDLCNNCVEIIYQESLVNKK